MSSVWIMHNHDHDRAFSSTRLGTCMVQCRAPPPTASAKTRKRYEDRNATEANDLAQFLQSQGQVVPESLLQQRALPGRSLPFGPRQASKHRRTEAGISF